jgi:hypothetical protein
MRSMAVPSLLETGLGRRFLVIIATELTAGRLPSSKYSMLGSRKNP